MRYSEMEEHLTAEVEKYFAVDIDTVLATTYKHDPAPARVGRDKYRKLLFRTYAGKGKWRTDAWSVIESKIRDEGMFVYDVGDAVTLCTYALYIEAAFLYLRDGTKREKFERLIKIVHNDVLRLGVSLPEVRDEDVSLRDQEIIFCAMTLCRLYMQRLEKIYPGT